jgi:hypothetical protein
LASSSSLSLPWPWRPTPTIPHSMCVSCTMPCHCSVGQEKGNNSSEKETRLICTRPFYSWDSKSPNPRPCLEEKKI